MQNKTYSDEHIESLIIAAKTDSMTGLLNHGASFDEMEAFLDNDTSASTHALFMLDLDNFKTLNDTLGHQHGDAILIKAATIIKNLFDKDDIIGRIGGDEFLVLMKNVQSIESLHDKAQALVSTLQFACSQENKGSVLVSSSVGAVICTGGKDKFSKVFYQADITMYNAKKGGKNNYFVDQATHLDEHSQEMSELSNFDVISLHNLFENIKVSVIIFDIDGNMPVYISPNYFNRLFITPKSKILTMEELKEIIYEKDRKAFLNFIEKHKEIKELSYRIIDGKGYIRWRLARASNLPTANEDEFNLALVIADITELKEQELALAESNVRANKYIKKLQMAFSPERQTMWEIDLNSNTLEIAYESKPYTTAFDENLASRLVKNGLLHANYADSFTKFIQQIIAGSSSGEAIVKLKLKEDELFKIARLKYSILNNAQNVAEKVIGIAEFMPNIIHDLHHYLWEKRFFESVQRSVSFQCCYNISLDKIESLYSDGSLLINSPEIMSYDAIQKRLASGIIGESMQKHFAMRFEKDKLQELYRNGDLNTHTEQYYLTEQDYQSWVAIESKMIVQPITGELALFIYGYHVNRRKHISSTCSSNMLDRYSFIIDADDFQEIIDSLVTSYKYVRSSHVFIYLNIVGIKDTDGIIHSLSMMDLDILYNQIRILFKDDFIIGKEKDNHLIFFKENVPDDTWIMMMLEETLAKIKDVFTPENGAEELIISAFVANSKTSYASYLSMLYKVYMLVEAIGNQGKDGGVFSFNLLDEDVRKHIDLLNTFQEEKTTKILGDNEKYIANRIALSMIRGNHYKNYIDSVLHELGAYYKADRVHLLKIIPSSQTVNCTDDWNNLNKFSAIFDYQNRKIAELPLVQKAINLKSSVISEEGQREMIVLIYYEDSIGGVIVIENATEYYDRADLAETVSAMLSTHKFNDFFDNFYTK